MPNYCYLCDKCDYKWSEFRTIGDHQRRCPKCESTEVGRDYQEEFSGISVVSDFGPGYNYGISEHYENKTDLLKKIRAKGFEPSRHDNGLKPVKRELYGDERRNKGKGTQSNVVIED